MVRGRKWEREREDLISVGLVLYTVHTLKGSTEGVEHTPLLLYGKPANLTM